MQIIAPTYITDSTLISCDIPIITPNTSEWNSTTTYTPGWRVSVNYEADGITPGVHRIYECTWTPNLNLYPPTHLEPSGGRYYWTLVSATEQWKLFDMIVAPDRAHAVDNVVGCDWEPDTIWEAGTKWDTNTRSSMQVSVEPGVIDAVALMNIDAESVAVIMEDPSAGEVYNETKIPSTAEYCNVVFEDLPSYPNAMTTVIVRSDSDVYVGEAIFGKLKTLGKARYGVNVGLTDFSTKQTNAFGEFEILERAFSKRIDCNFMMSLAAHSGVMRILENYRSTPLVWIISNDYSTTLIYGYYRDFSINVPNLAIAECALSIEGLGGDMVYANPVPDPWVPVWDGFNKLDIPTAPTIAAPTTAKIEETPVSVPTASLTMLTAPTVAAPTIEVYALADTDGVCTISNAAPAVVTCTTHGLVDNQKLVFQTTGALPLPLIAGNYYYVNAIDADTFNVTLTAGGSTIDTTDAGSGTHKVLGKV